MGVLEQYRMQDVNEMRAKPSSLRVEYIISAVTPSDSPTTNRFDSGKPSK
jgi:hypothetical protein